MPNNTFDFYSRRSFLRNAGLGCGSLALTNL
ncbi:MAG: twin-arginine translocation signal domain-containing protein, partial [Rhodospirillales bacterium]